MADWSGFEITPTELADRLEGGDSLQVLDIRAPASVAAGTIDAPRFHNVRGLSLIHI